MGEVTKKKMRRGVDYIGVGVGAAIIRDGKILLSKRGEKAQNEAGKWEIPGGAVEFGETMEQALNREMKEELGVEIGIVELLGVFDHIIPEEKQHWVSPTFICRIMRGEPENLEIEKADEIGWFSLEEAEKLPLSLITQNDIRILKKKYPGGLTVENV
jgi:mutator protein MutT